MNRLLLIEDDEMTSAQMKWGLHKDFEVLTASNRKDAVEINKDSRPPVVILDLGLPPYENDTVEGFSCLEEIISITPHTKVIIISGKGDKKNALKAIRMGAYDFFQKPIDMEVLRIMLNRAFYLSSIEQENIRLKERDGSMGDDIFEGMIGCSRNMNKVFSLIRKVSATDVTVLITGESGTGKELAARAIHSQSMRKNGPFVPINCTTIPEHLLESELFGFERGAFTDAKTKKAGLVEKAIGGTLFLDEIGDLPLSLQAKLLRFIQERSFKRLGSEKELTADVRLITATNTDLKKAVAEKSFRDDLYFRINVINLSMPPLRDRDDDLVLLAKNFLLHGNKKYKKNFKGFTKKAITMIKGYGWPGNVRELQNTIAHAVIVGEGDRINANDLSFADYEYYNHGTYDLISLKEARAAADVAIIQKALISCNGNISKTAEALKVTRPTLHDLLKKYSLNLRSANLKTKDKA